MATTLVSPSNSPQPRSNKFHRTAEQVKNPTGGPTNPSQGFYSPTFKGSSKMLAKGVKVLSRKLPTGFQNFFTLRYLGNRKGTEVWGCYVVCPECGARPDHDIVPPHRRWQWLTMHTLVAHREVFVPTGKPM